jgi:hypothetical protein
MTYVWITIGGFFFQDLGESVDVMVPADKTRPSIQLIQDDLLLSANAALGVYISFEGQPVNKNPIHWSEDPVAFFRCQFYLVALVRSAVEMFSTIDQKLVQRVPLPLGRGAALGDPAVAGAAAAAPAGAALANSGFGSKMASGLSYLTGKVGLTKDGSVGAAGGSFTGVAMAGSDEEVFVCSETQVYRLRPTPIEEQVSAWVHFLQFGLCSVRVGLLVHISSNC